MKTVMNIVVAAASITGATVPAAAQPAAPGFYFGAPSVAVTVGPRHYYRAARYVWGHYHYGYFQADPRTSGCTRPVSAKCQERPSRLTVNRLRYALDLGVLGYIHNREHPLKKDRA
jgi:hypothetical protein